MPDQMMPDRYQFGDAAERRRDYEIGSVTKALRVLEALEGIGFEPVTMNTVVGRTGFSKDFVFRALKTLELRGYAQRIGVKWTVGKRLTRFVAQAARTQIV